VGEEITTHEKREGPEPPGTWQELFEPEERAEPKSIREPDSIRGPLGDPLDSDTFKELFPDEASKKKTKDTFDDLFGRQEGSQDRSSGEPSGTAGKEPPTSNPSESGERTSSVPGGSTLDLERVLEDEEEERDGEEDPLEPGGDLWIVDDPAGTEKKEGPDLSRSKPGSGGAGDISIYLGGRHRMGSEGGSRHQPMRSRSEEDRLPEEDSASNPLPAKRTKFYWVMVLILLAMVVLVVLFWLVF